MRGLKNKELRLRILKRMNEYLYPIKSIDKPDTLEPTNCPIARTKKGSPIPIECSLGKILIPHKI